MSLYAYQDAELLNYHIQCNYNRRRLFTAYDTCVRERILSDVLQENRDEVIEMYYWEYNEEEHRWAIEQDAKEQGTLIERIRQITKKVNKGKSLDQIADEMEIDSADLKPLWEAVLSEAPDYDEKKIMEKIFSLEGKECSSSH